MIKKIKIIIFFICLIIIYAIILNFKSNFNDKKKKELHAMQWCQTLAEAILKFNKFEKTEITSQYMIELRGKYIQGLETWKDPWGNRYKLDYKKGIVYSSGPNGIDFDSDDIVVKYK